MEEDGRELTKWEKVLELVRLAFRNGVLPEEAAWKAVVLIPKEGGDYCSIGLVAVILNCRFTAAITYHDFLHGFRVSRSTGTSTLNLNMLQQVAALR